MKPERLEDVLKQAIARCGMTSYQLEKATGVHRGSIDRFCRGIHVLRLDKADDLAVFLGVRIQSPNRKG